VISAKVILCVRASLALLLQETKGAIACTSMVVAKRKEGCAKN
jgi:hypothetical protein